MTILELQRRYRELGRLRIGATVPGDTGKRPRPIRLSTWRLTSPSAELLEQAATIFGGGVSRWEGAPTEGTQWELITDAEQLDVLVPPQDLVGRQYLELWSGGGVKRRRDGATELLSGGPCKCDSEARECSPVTMLQVMLPQLPDIGTWRVVTRSWNAGAELPGTVELLAKLAAKGAIPRAVLAIEARTVKRDGRTQHFSLPVLQVPWSLAQAEREGVPILEAGKPALVRGVTELPPDPSFAHDQATFGPEADLPTSADLADAIEAPVPAPQSVAIDDGAALDGGEPVSAMPGSSPDVPPQRAAGEKTGQEGATDEGHGPAAGDLGNGPAAGHGPAWIRYNTALLALPNPSLVGAITKRTIRKAGLSPPVAPDWPEDLLEQLAGLLESAANHPAGADS